jgi:hypothetical protein
MQASPKFGQLELGFHYCHRIHIRCHFSDKHNRAVRRRLKRMSSDLCGTCCELTPSMTSSTLITGWFMPVSDSQIRWFRHKPFFVREAVPRVLFIDVLRRRHLAWSSRPGW